MLFTRVGYTLCIVLSCRFASLQAHAGLIYRYVVTLKAEKKR